MDGSAQEERNDMAYAKPRGFTRRVVNPLVSRLHSGGVETLTVVGRRTGRPHAVPVIPVQIGDSRYLVSPYGEADWVRNLRASGEGALQGRGTPREHRAAGRPAGPVRGLTRRETRGDCRELTSAARRPRGESDHPR